MWTCVALNMTSFYDIRCITDLGHVQASRVDIEGWTWVWLANTLMVWNIHNNGQVTELRVPSSGGSLGLKICLFPTSKAGDIGVITVTAVGDVHYWPSIKHPKTKATTRLFTDNDDGVEETVSCCVRLRVRFYSQYIALNITMQGMR